MKLRMVGLVAVLALGAVVLQGCRCLKGSGSCGAGRCAMKGSVERMEGTINTEGLAALLQAKVPLSLLDARTGKFDDGRRIPGAKAIHAGMTDAELRSALPDSKGLVVTYCGGLQCPASAKLASRLRGLGFENIVEFPEGIEGWVATGRPVEESKK